MTSPAGRAARWALALGVVALVVALVRPGQRPLVVDAYVLFVGALALAVLVTATRTAVPAERDSLFARALVRTPPPPARPADLERLEREVLLASAGAFDLHYRLRPVLRGIAAHRLSVRRGIDLDASPAAARAVLSPAAWEIVRPDREPPADRLSRGRPLRELRDAVDSLEAV